MGHIFILALLNALSGFHFFLIAYISGPYLATFLSPSLIGMVYSFSAVLTLLGFILIPRLIRTYPTGKLALALAGLNVAVLLSLALFNTHTIAILGIALHSVCAALIAYTLDIFLEEATKDEGETGLIRGIFLTAVNISLVLSPITIGFLLGNTEIYTPIFLAASLAIVLFMLLLQFRRMRITDICVPRASTLRDTLSCLSENTSSRRILILNTLLQSFFIWAPVYIPLYLHIELGIPWSTLGPLFAIMLLPFVLLELPVGRFLDRYHGEGRVMALGFIITGASFASLAFVVTEPIYVLAMVLILTRVGAALIEIGAETAYFRSVGGADANSVSVFRMTRPLGMFVGPFFGSALLLILPVQFVFIPLGLFMLFTAPLALRIAREVLSKKTEPVTVPCSQTLPQKG